MAVLKIELGELLFTELYAKIDQLLAKVTHMAGELDALRAEVANNTTVVGSAVQLLQNLKKALDDAIASGDMSQVKALSDTLGANDQALAQAVVDNTPNPPPQP